MHFCCFFLSSNAQTKRKNIKTVYNRNEKWPVIIINVQFAHDVRSFAKVSNLMHKTWFNAPSSSFSFSFCTFFAALFVVATEKWLFLLAFPKKLWPCNVQRFLTMTIYLIMSIYKQYYEPFTLCKWSSSVISEKWKKIVRKKANPISSPFIFELGISFTTFFLLLQFLRTFFGC